MAAAMALTSSNSMLSTLTLHHRNRLNDRRGVTSTVSAISLCHHVAAAHSGSHLTKLARVRSSAEQTGSQAPISNSINSASSSKFWRLQAAVGDAEVIAEVEQEEVPRTELAEKPWTERALPKAIVPYAQLLRWDNLGPGPWVTIAPYFWAVALAAQNGSGPDLRILALIGAAGWVMGQSICIINDLMDRDFDGKVERTKMRPLVTGAVTPLQGWLFFASQVALYWAILMQLGNFSELKMLVGIQGLLQGTYPLMKRWTFWPQAYLGLAMTWSQCIGWAAVRGVSDPMGLAPLFIAGCFWVLVYETIYTYQDVKDDVKAGVKSTALLFGNNTKLFLAGFSSACIAGLGAAGYTASLGWPFYAVVVAAAGHLAWQVSTVDLDNPADCGAKFMSNRLFATLVFAGIMLGKLLA